MIYYDSSGNSFTTLLRFYGSVAPRAFALALPCGICGALLCALRQYSTGYQEGVPDESVQVGSFIAFNSILGFLIVFRTQNAYRRYWEGLSLIHKVRGDLLNATSHVFAFLSEAEERQEEVLGTKHLLVKLVSMMFCTALQSVAVSNRTNFEIVSAEGISPAQLRYLANAPDPPVVLMHWIQRVVVKCLRKQVVDIPPPVLSRVFHELSNAVVALHDATKISDTPFPFAFAQMIAWMLATQFVMTPLISSSMTDSVFLAGGGSFIAVFLTFSMNLIASEIELPFGSDPNDLPLDEMQQTMNVSLLTLMHSHTQTTPSISFRHRYAVKLMMWQDCVDAAEAAPDGLPEGESGDADASDIEGGDDGARREQSAFGTSTDAIVAVRSESARSNMVMYSKKKTVASTKYDHQKYKMLLRQGKIDHPIRTIFFNENGSKSLPIAKQEGREPESMATIPGLPPVVVLPTSEGSSAARDNEIIAREQDLSSHREDVSSKDARNTGKQHTGKVTFAADPGGEELEVRLESQDQRHRARL